METIGERIRHLRKEILDKTQKEFGERIGLKPNSVSDIESGRNNLTEQTANAICREFRVNKEWIYTGKGDPVIALTRNQEISKFMNDVMTLPDEDIKKRLINSMSKLSENELETLAKIAEALRGES